MADNVVLTVMQAAASYDLTDYETAKNELGIDASNTKDDEFITRNVSQVSAAAANYCNRVFQVEQLTEVIYIERPRLPGHQGFSDTLQLSRWPLVNVSSVIENLGQDDENDLVLGTDYLVKSPANGQLLRLDSDTANPAPWCARFVTIVYTAGYGAQGTQAATVPATGPYTIEVANADEFSIDLGVTYSNGTALVAVTGAPSAGQYAVNDGTYTFAAADASAGVDITYAWNDIPLDLVEAVLRGVTQRFKARTRDPMMMRQDQPGGAGMQQWWVGMQRGQRSVFPPEISCLLDSYAVPIYG